MRRWQLGLSGTLASAVLQLVLAVALGRTPLYANATCSVDCNGAGPDLTCSSSGTGCSCDAQSGVKCESSCINGSGEPDIKECEGPLMAP